MVKTLHKLTGDEQMELVKRIAWYWRDSEIVQYIKDSYGKEMIQQNVQWYRHAENWKVHIENIREKYLNNLTEVACANKKVRLEELQRHYNRYMDKKEFKLAIGVLRDFRDEMMEKKIGDLVISNNFTQINNQ